MFSPPDLEALAEDLRLQYGESLAGLLRQGLALIERREPGVAFLLAHAGRELSNGIGRHLAEEEGLVASTSRSCDDGHKTSNRARLAAILDCDQTHPRVTRWVDAHDALVRLVHYSQRSASHDEAVTSFLEMAHVAHSLVGDFRSMKQELEQIAEIDAPTEEDVRYAVHRLMRVQQRRVFYARLRSPHWLRPLIAHGQVIPPPERITDGNTWTVAPWPEQDYLLRVAGVEPELVRDVLLQVPSSNTNPLVWHFAAKAAKAMPPSVAAPIALRLAEALPHVPRVFGAHEPIQLAIRLAESEPTVALRLVEGLLFLNRYVASDEDENANSIKRLLRGTDWMLRCVSSGELDELMRRAVPTIAAGQPLELIELLARRLQFAVVQARKAQGSGEPDAEPTIHWCDDVERFNAALEYGDVRAVLATSIWRVLRDYCGGGSDTAVAAFVKLGPLKGEIFTRLRMKLAAHCEGVDGGEVDALISHSDALDRLFHTPELRELFARRAGAAAPNVVNALVERIAMGPAPQAILRIATMERFVAARQAGATEYLVPDALDDLSVAERDRVVLQWQAQRLALLGDSASIVAGDLVSAVRAAGLEIPHDRSPEEAPVDQSAGGGHSRPPEDIEADVQLPTLPPLEASDREIVHALSAITEGSSGAAWGDSGPFLDRLRNILVAQPSRAGAVLWRALETCVSPRPIQLLLDVLRALAQDRQALPWVEVVGAARPLLARAATETDAAGASEGVAPAFLLRVSELSVWPSVVSTYLELVDLCIRHELLPPEVAGELSEVLDAFVDYWWTVRFMASSGVDASGRRRKTVGEELVPALVRVVAAASFWRTEIVERHAEAAPEGALELVAAPRLERMFSVGEMYHTVLVDAVGRTLPLLLYSDREWVERNRHVLFGDEVLALALTWSLCRYSYHLGTLDALRDELTRLVSLMSQEEQSAKEGKDWRRELAGALAAKLRDAWLRGHLETVEAVALLNSSFDLAAKIGDRLPYWGIFRSLTDAKEPVAHDVLVRCLELWRLRLSVLEGRQSSDALRREAGELLWLLTTPHLPAAEAAQLGIRTVRLDPARLPPLKRFDELLAADPASTFDLIVALAENTLKRRAAYLSVDSVAPVFRSALRGDDVPRRNEARRLLGRLARYQDPRFADVDIDGES